LEADVSLHEIVKNKQNPKRKTLCIICVKFA
jgi:hypothetical protein